MRACTQKERSILPVIRLVHSPITDSGNLVRASLVVSHARPSRPRGPRWVRTGERLAESAALRTHEAVGRRVTAIPVSAVHQDGRSDFASSHVQLFLFSPSDREFQLRPDQAVRSRSMLILR